MKMVNWSQEQLDIIGEAEESRANLMVNATAGSGKTTLLVEGICGRMPRGTVLTAFGKKAADELQKKVPSHVRACTINSYWFAFLKTVMTRNLKVDGYKCRRIVDSKMPELEDASYNIMQLVGIGKGNGVGLITSDEEGVWLELIDHHDLSVEGVEDLVIAQAASKVLAWSNKDFASIDFDDMMYMSLKLILERGFQPDVGPCVLVDECQDLNPLQATLLPYMGKSVISVGAAFHAIFGVLGAGIGAMDNLKVMVDMGC